MIRRSKEKISVRKPAPFDGVGEITVRSLLNGPEEMSQKGRVFGHTTVYPGSEIGYHIHNGDSETYYILSGKGRYNDNGTWRLARAMWLIARRARDMDWLVMVRNPWK